MSTVTAGAVRAQGFRLKQHFSLAIIGKGLAAAAAQWIGCDG
jgi:hypothetical protein